MPGSPRPRIPAFRHFLLNPVSLGYLGLVVAVWAVVGVDALLVERAEASTAAVWGFLVTAPSSLVFVPASGPLLWAGVAAAAVFQALLFGIVCFGVPAEAHRGAGAPARR